MEDVPERPIVFNHALASTPGPTVLTGGRHPWIADTGASNTIVTDRDNILDYTEIDPTDRRYTYLTSAAALANPTGKGKYQLQFVGTQGKITECKVPCLHFPGLQCNLLAAEKMKKTLGLVYDSEKCVIRKLNSDIIVAHTETQNDVAYIKTAPPTMIMATISARTLHRQLGHCGSKYLKNTARYMDFREEIATSENFNCEPCHLAKSK